MEINLPLLPLKESFWGGDYTIELPCRLFTCLEAAAYLGLSVSRLWELRSEGVVPTYRVMGKPVFKLEDLNAFLIQRAEQRLAKLHGEA